MSVTSITTANGSGLTASNPTGAVNLNTSILTDNGLSVVGNIDKTFTLSMPTPFVNNISLTDQVTSGASITLQSSGTVGTDTYTLPTAYPTVAGQVLSSDTSGTMSWITGGTSGFPDPVTTDLDMNNNAIINVKGLSLSNTVNSNIVGLASSDTLTQTSVYTLPDAYPTVAGQVLSSDTSGTMSWITSSGSGNFSTPSTEDLDMNFYTIINIKGLSLSTNSYLDMNMNNIESVNGIYFTNPTNPNYISLKSPNALTASNNYILPSAYPTVAGQVLSSNTSGTMSWATTGNFSTPSTQDLDMGGRDIDNCNTIATNLTGTQSLRVYVNPSTGNSYYNEFLTENTQQQNISYKLPTTSPADNGLGLLSTAGGILSWGVVGNFSSPAKGLLNMDNNEINNVKSINILDPQKAYRTIIKGQNQTTDVTYTLPSGYPTFGSQVLTSDSSGNFSWIPGGTGNFSTPTDVNLDMNYKDIRNAASLFLVNNVSSFFTKISPAVTATTNSSYNLPAALPTTTGQVLSSDTSGVMTWVDNSSTVKASGKFPLASISLSNPSTNVWTGNVALNSSGLNFPAGEYIFSINVSPISGYTFNSDSSIVTGLGFTSTTSTYLEYNSVLSGITLSGAYHMSTVFNLDYNGTSTIYISIGIQGDVTFGGGGNNTMFVRANYQQVQ